MIAMLRLKLVHFRSLEDDGTSAMKKVRQYSTIVDLHFHLYGYWEIAKPLLI
jgi:hypothetical protein